MTTLAEGFLRASLMRTESRAGHFREDFPIRDDTRWLSWVLMSRKDGEMKLRREPLPIDTYKFQPKSFYSDNFHFSC